MKLFTHLTALWLCAFSLCAEQAKFKKSSYQIIETPHFSDLKKYISPDTLVLLDIDDTLLIPKQTLGTDIWFQYQLKKNQNEPDSFDKTLAQWEAIRHLTQIQIVEPESEKIISELQKQNIPIIGLTTQGLALATRTVNQLKELQIDLRKTAPSQEDHYFMNGIGVLYRQGILFTSGTPKGPGLEKLLRIIGFSPKKIVFINDKQSHLLDVAHTVRALGIDFIGLRYSYSDERIHHFNSKLADIQFEFSTISHILSDEEALSLLEASNC